MIKAIDINWSPAKKGGFVKARIEKLIYQKWFLNEPSIGDVCEAIESFETNYAGLNEQAKQPGFVKKHHLED